MGCKCSRDGNGYNNNHFEQDYYNQKNENDELKKIIEGFQEEKKKNEKNKINNIPFNSNDRGGSNSSQSSIPEDTIQVLFNGKKLSLNIKKNKDTIAKIIARFGEKYNDLEYQGICYYRGNRLKANKKYNELDFSNDEQLTIT